MQIYLPYPSVRITALAIGFGDSQSWQNLNEMLLYNRLLKTPDCCLAV